MNDIDTLDYHTAGEPLRIVISGLPGVEGQTMLERRDYFRRHLDDYRRMLMLEPRGHADMYGAVLTPPATADGDVGVLFLHNEGYSTMCGHGIIALVRAGLDHQLFDCADESRILIDAPAGRIIASAARDGSGTISSVSFENVASFVLDDGLKVNLDGVEVEYTVAYGGAYYAYVDAQTFGLDLVPAEADELIRLGRRLKQRISDDYTIAHPGPDAALGFLYGVIFVASGHDVSRSKNVCIFADGQVDRSPTGTGVCGRAAIHHARGEIGLEQTLTVESLIGTEFRVRCLAETRLGDYPAIIPEVTGNAWACGRNRFHMQPDDPLKAGFLIR